MNTILLINGPNLNLLGTREPEKYGKASLKNVEDAMREQCKAHGATLLCFQSNSEGAIIDRIHQAKTDKVDAIIINPGAYTHTSIAIRDAFLSVNIPFIEVHLTNIFARESFRHHSYLSDIAKGCIIGLGVEGYRLAAEFFLTRQ